MIADVSTAWHLVVFGANLTNVSRHCDFFFLTFNSYQSTYCSIFCICISLYDMLLKQTNGVYMYVLFCLCSRHIQDPASQRLTWNKPPVNVLVIRKIRDESLVEPFKELCRFLVEVQNHTIHYAVWFIY